MVGKTPNVRTPRSGGRAARPAGRKPRREPSAGARPSHPAGGDGETAWRIARVIARAGLASRRQAEEWIAAGRVAVNGTIISSAALNVTAADQVMIDGRPLPARERTRLFLYHKPRGVVTTGADPQGRPTIFDALPGDLPRLMSVGRLDLTSEGLLLLTNDGGLARTLELPATGWLRRYRVRAHGRVTQEQLDRLRSGTTVDGIHYGPIEAILDRAQGSNMWLTVALREGKNREVRNVLGAMGLQVNRLIRISFGPFQLGDLGEGQVQEVRTRTLREQIGERLAAAAGVDFSAPKAPEPRGDVSASKPRHTDDGARASEATTRGSVRPRARHARTRPHERDGSARRETGHAGGAAAPGAADRSGQQPRGEAHQPSVPSAKRKARGSRGSHVWRDRDAPPRVFSAKSRRRHGANQARAEPEAVPRPKRLALVTDRKGRRVVIERIGEPKAAPASPRRDAPKRRRDDHRGRPKDRR